MSSANAARSANSPAVVDAMNRAVVAVLKEPATRAKLIDLGLEPLGSTPQEFDRFFQSEIRRWKELVQISGATPG